MGIFKKLFGPSEKGSVETPNEVSEESAVSVKVSFKTLCDDGVRAKNMGEITYAISCFKEALKMKPDDAICMSYLAELFLRVDRTSEAYVLLCKLVVREPDNKKLLLNTIKAGLTLEKWQEASEMCEILIKLDDNEALSHLFMAQARFGLGQNDEALKSFADAIARNKIFFDAYYQRAKAYFKLKEYDKALVDINFLITKGVGDEDIYILLGDILVAQEDVKKAFKAYDKAKEINPFSYEASEHTIKVLISEDSWMKALKQCNDLIESYEHSAGVYALRAKVFRALENEEAAKKDEEKYKELLQLHEDKVSEEYTDISNKMKEHYRDMNPYGF